MNNVTQTKGVGWTSQLKARLFGVLVGLGLAATLCSTAHAAPAAGTTIGNQASISYTDSSSLTQVATSNIVQTTVTQVGSLSLVAANTKSAAAGQTVYMPHTLTNTGNGTDTFTITATGASFQKVEIYSASTGNGLPDSTTPLCSSTATACTTGFTVSVAAGATYDYVVALTVAGNAGNSSAVTAQTTVTAAQTTLYTTSSLNLTDTVNVTTGAAFQVVNAFGAPSANSGVSAPSPLASWPTGLPSMQRSAGTCTATLASVGTAGCNYATVTLQYQHTGGTAGNVYLNDVLPAGLTYVAGSAKWSSGNQTLSDASTNPTGIDYNVSGNTVSAVVAGVNPNVTGSISFIVMVNSDSTAALGKTAATSNTPVYTAAGCTNTTIALCSGAGSTTVSANSAAITVLQTYAVVANTISASASTLPANKTATVASSSPGAQVAFTNYVWNTGIGTDTFNITAPTLTIGGVTVTPAFYMADGVTPLADTNGDGSVDTGPVAAGVSAALVVKYTVPSGACPSTCAAGPFSLVVTATSAGDPTKTSTVTDTLTGLVASTVTVSATPTSYSTAAGNTQKIDLTVNNTSAATSIYNLTAPVSSSTATGWSVFFTSGTCASAGPVVTSTGPLATGTPTAFCANVVTSAASTSGNAVTYNFTATSAANGASGLVSVTVTISANAKLSITSSQTGQVAAGGPVVLPFTVQNVGNTTCGGTVAVSATLDTASANAGWIALVYDDNGSGQISSSSTPLSGSWTKTLTTASGATPAGYLLVRVFAPAGAPVGARATVTLTVDASASANACPAVSATGVATVVSGQIRAQKKQARDDACNGTLTTALDTAAITAKPGQCIRYEISGTNQGIAQVNSVTINDTIPANATYQASPAPTCDLAGSTINTGSASVSCGGAGTSILPGSTVKFTYTIKINP